MAVNVKGDIALSGKAKPCSKCEKYRQAITMLSALKPDSVMDPENPVSVAKEVVDFIAPQIEELTHLRIAIEEARTNSTNLERTLELCQAELKAAQQLLDEEAG